VGKPATRPNTTVKAVIARKGLTMAQATPLTVLHVADRSVAPGKDRKRLAISPKPCDIRGILAANISSSQMLFCLG
jgi:hypothetical protein